MASTTTSELLNQAKSDPKHAESLYQQILNHNSAADASAGQKEQVLRDQHTALIKLGELYRDQGDPQKLASVITLSRSFLTSSAKAKTASLIRTLLSYFSAIPSPSTTNPILIDTLRSNIEWATSEKRVFLRHSLETRLVGLLITQGEHKQALVLIDGLLRELKRLDDKLVLTEVHLLESRVYRAVGNLPKAKAALTSARTAANSIYCPPHLQSSLDLQSGILHAEDKDYTTAYSYFFEAFENLENQATAKAASGEGAQEYAGDEDSLKALKYMLLCKVMLNLSEDVTALLSGSVKLATKYTSRRDVESMRAVARAHQNRSLSEFETALREWKQELSSDPTIRTHLAGLYDTLLEQNLLRIVEPYSVVDIDYVAKGVGQGRREVETKLSQMILDKVLHGVLDQGRGCLIVFEKPEEDDTYGAAIATLEQVGKVVDSLYAKSVKIA